ncbi:zinc finger and BTB domain-containing protein 18.2-like [Vespa velutina]|uniref:zinc finger and BTB domain-containing protein 18.2-like n=1 Tax=Vespa velutina TaxID=202808 RepID=UPI001FB569D0|nr:zinc finger and BTB domain-containing protein 18.2-like [Vespa velutina]
MANIGSSNPLLINFSGFFAGLGWSGEGVGTRRTSSRNSSEDVPAPLTPQRRARLHCPGRHSGRNNNRPLGSIQTSGHDRRHNCSRCGKSYKNAYILKRHILYECGKAPSFSCPHCAFSSKYERNLKAHINHRHVDVVQSAQSAATALNQRA